MLSDNQNRLKYLVSLVRSPLILFTEAFIGTYPAADWLRPAGYAW